MSLTSAIDWNIRQFPTLIPNQSIPEVSAWTGAPLSIYNRTAMPNAHPSSHGRNLGLLSTCALDNYRYQTHERNIMKFNLLIPKHLCALDNYRYQTHERNIMKFNLLIFFLFKYHFYRRPVLAFGYCRCLCVCVCMCVCPCVRQSWACPCDNSATIQSRITKF